ncbi:MobF family relaxase [Nocardia salmonicida]|uniref:MobF family relaxase n=1 Tax=Nocardia salmonicida TaxID=53431 RepID=UPI0033CAF930
MVATIHKVAAGNGYQYYLRNVAAHDATARGRSSLADYYSAHGDAPGRWHGSGLAALGISAGEEVTEQQMKNLFGLGIHPNAEQIEDHVYTTQRDLGATDNQATREADKASKLGRKFAVFEPHSDYRKLCADAYREYNIARKEDPSSAIPDVERARIRSEVATEMFTLEYDRAPLNARELSGWVAKNSRPERTAVAGFDITFSPVKSVSALWALAPPEVATRIEAAHQAAVHDALAWIEDNALYTRLGRGGIRQVDVEGIVAASFTHRDSRAGDPDLHTHVLIANRVRAADGQWRTIDAAVVYEAIVTASEIYDSRIEHHLETALDLQFDTRPDRGTDKVRVREIIGIPVELIEIWSQRRTAITARLDVLTAAFQTTFGREPAPGEVHQLAQRATLETRPAKHLPLSHAAQQDEWARQVRTLFGSDTAVHDIVNRSLSQPDIIRPLIDDAFVDRAARDALQATAIRRSTWKVFNLRAEVERQLRGLVEPTQWRTVAQRVLTTALRAPSVIARGDPDLTEQPTLRAVPRYLRRHDGTPVHVRANSQIYTTESTLAAEAALIEFSIEPGARVLDPALVAESVADYNTAHPDRPLNAGQIGVIGSFATSGLRVHTANAPAGTGKTTAMQVLTTAWHSSGGTVLGMAPTAAAAAVLGESIGTRAETVDKLLDIINRHTPSPNNPAIAGDHPASLPQWVLDIDNRTLVVVDEHVKLGNTKRLHLLQYLSGRGATVRCIGDDRQLPAIEAGGADADMSAASPEHTLTLSHVVRFASTAEATASIGLREADPSALAWYLDNDRIHAGHTGSVYDDTYQAWAADDLAGLDAVMLAPTHDVVTALNARGRADRLARTDTETGPEVVLVDGLCASIGDTVRTRRNNPKLRFGDHDWVRNGYSWTVTDVHNDGSLTVSHRHRGADSDQTVRLPVEYVRAHVRLGYASTIDSAQGITADACHVALSGRESRQQFYVAMTRGIHANHVHIVTALDGAEGAIYTEPATYPRTAVEILQRVMARDGAHKSAHTELRDALDPALRIGRAVDVYLDTLGLAAEHALGPDRLEALDHAADTVHPNLTDNPAYPVLRQHLALIALTGADPVAALRTAADTRELDTADDPAAVLDWRLDPTGAHSAGAGPLSWTPGLPRGVIDQTLAEPVRAREQIVIALAAQIRDTAQRWTPSTAPAWARPLLGTHPTLLGELAVWRAGLHVADTDVRPTGPARYTDVERNHQQRLEQQIIDAYGDPALPRNRWAEVVETIDPRITTDIYWPIVADKIDLADRAGLDITTLLTNAAALRPLPDEMPAAALWARLDLEPAALDTIHDGNWLRPDWLPDLEAVLGAELANQVAADAAWPRLVAAVERTAPMWVPREVLTTAHELLLGAQPTDPEPLRADQLTAALAWRIDVLIHPAETPDMDTPEPPPQAEPDGQPVHTTSHNIDAAVAAATGEHHDPPSTETTIQQVARLFAEGQIDTAITVFRGFNNGLSSAERGVLTAVAETLYQYSFPVAAARLRWAATHFPDHRDLITACTPQVDPRTYRPDWRSPARTRRPAARDHRERIDSTLRAAEFDPIQAAGTDVADQYLEENREPDAERARREARTRPTTNNSGWPVDHLRAVVDGARELACVDCGLERPNSAKTPVPPRRSDDGLCQPCRDDNRPSIPDHDPADYIAARSAHISAIHPPAAALAMLRRDWRVLNPRDQAVLERWIRDHPPAEPPLPDLNPLQRLTDQELAESLDGLHRRLDSVDTDAHIYGPVRHAVSEPAPDPAVIAHRDAADAARLHARRCGDELETAIRRLERTTSALDLAREDLDATPLIRRRHRTTIQARINSLAVELRRDTDSHQHARTNARAANRAANDLIAIAARAATDAAARHATEQAERARIEDQSHIGTVAQLRTMVTTDIAAHHDEQQRRDQLSPAQRDREDRARRRAAMIEVGGVDVEEGRSPVPDVPVEPGHGPDL